MSSTEVNELTAATEKLSVEDTEVSAKETKAEDVKATEKATAAEGEESKPAESKSESKSGESEAAISSLYVGDLDPTVTESDLYEVFSRVGQVSSIRVCRDAVSKHSLCYAYVNYQKHEDAERAMDELAFCDIKGKQCRIMWSQRDPSLRKNGTGNIFIKNLHPAIDNKTLYDTFSAFGRILSCKIATDENGNSKGFGFVHYEDSESARAAIENVNGMLLNDLEVYVALHVPKKDRQSKMEELVHNFTNVYVKNYNTEWTEPQLRAEFEKYGPITSVYMARDNEGKSRGFGFVNFENHEDAFNAVEALNGKDIDGRTLYVGRAQKKRERQEALKHQWEQARQERLSKYQGINLFVKNLDDSVDDAKLEEEFAPYGSITSAKVMIDETGKSKGFGFVCFTKPEEATRAINEMHQRMVAGKPLYVALAQRKEVRRNQLNQQFQQRNQMRLQQAAVQGGMGQFVAPMFYGQNAGFLPPMPAGVRGGPFAGAAGPQLMMQQGAPRPGQGVPVGAPGQFRVGPNGQPVPMYVQPMFNEYQQQQQQRYYQRPNHGANGAVNGAAQKKSGKPDEQQQQQPVPAPGAPAANLADVLPQLAPEQQKRVLGEELYAKIESTGKASDKEAVGKITGMMLSMDNQQILDMLKDEGLFNTQFDQALAAYENYRKGPEAASASAPFTEQAPAAGPA
ncbi:DEKNAAC100631 [Brettanomyces naardenensis]|uniref:Polyadenylate-binding protein n=1 Tax=Brettanomyces naardenensis TaxID=13370 RepID=A0A448YEX4_BRENA|nr:DEKNAAC100631 [Brettanomyces naardenensis]